MPGGAPTGKRHAPRGAGSVYKETIKRKNGAVDFRWVGALSLEGGKRKRVTAPTQREALAKLRQLIADQVHGIPISTDRQTVAAYLDWWLAHSARVKPTTRVLYGQVLRMHITPAIGRYELSKLRPQHVEKMITDMEAKGYAPATINGARSVLRTALGVAVKRELIARNAAALVDPVRHEHRETEPLSGEECQRWIAALGGHPQLGALFVTAITTGLRRGELLGLRWKDVDLAHARLSVRQQVQLVPGADGKLHRTFTTPKTRLSNRAVPLPTFLVDLLQAHHERQRLERMAAGPDWQDFDLVFPGRDGGPRNATAVWLTFQRALDRAGIERHPFHYLRHVYASLLMALGVHPFVATRLLGHSDSHMTERYSHVAEASLRAASDQIDAFLRDPREHAARSDVEPRPKRLLG